MTNIIREGDKVPSFSAKDQFGKIFTNKDLLGHVTVLYFYPKDNTLHCTKEACDLRDNLGKLSALNVQVVGISPDSIESHYRFSAAHYLNFTLLSDEDTSLCKLFGVWRRFNFGIKALGVQRSSFVINPDGIVTYVERGVNIRGHVDRLLAAIQKMR